MIVEMACLYTNCDCPSRRSSTQKLSNQVITPCSFTPLIKKIVTEILDFLTLFRNASCKLCLSAAIVTSPFYTLPLSFVLVRIMAHYRPVPIKFPAPKSGPIPTHPGTPARVGIGRWLADPSAAIWLIARAERRRQRPILPRPARISPKLPISASFELEVDHYSCA